MSSIQRPSGGNGCPASKGAGGQGAPNGAGGANSTASTQFAQDLQNIASNPSNASQYLQDAVNQFERMGSGSTVSSFEQALDAQEQAAGMSDQQIASLNSLVEQLFGPPSSTLSAPTTSGSSAPSIQPPAA